MRRNVYDDGDYKKDVPEHQQTNHLLINKKLGQVKKSVYRLPNSDHVYGYTDASDHEGAHDLLSNWSQHIPNDAPVPERDFVQLNKYATMNGCITAKNVAVYRRTNDIRRGDNSNQPYYGMYFPNQTSVYGKPSAPSAQINKLLTNEYQRNYIHAKRAQDARRSMQRRPRSTIAHTKASLGHTKVPAQPAKPMYKMKRFANVESRVRQYTGRDNFARTTGSAVAYGAAM